MSRWHRQTGLIAAVLIALAGCGAADRSGQEASGEPALALTWDDLLPEGAKQDLAAEYDAFYEELDRKLAMTAMPLADGAETLQTIEEGSSLDYMPQLGSFETVPDLDGQRVRLPGFIVPLDGQFQGTFDSFLLVPYFGACIHTPPPPPNQLVLVDGEITLHGDDLWLAHVVTGTLHAEENHQDLGNTAYRLELEKIEVYEGL